MTGKYGDLIREARKPEVQESDLPDNQETGKPAIQPQDDPSVNLGVKVPRSLRRHWAAESKRRGVSMTSIIIKALTDEFGEP